MRSIISDNRKPKIMPVHMWVLIPENISIDKIGKIRVLKKVIHVTVPLRLSFLKRELIFFSFIRGSTAKITIIPNVDLGKSKSNGVAYNNVIITISIVVIDEIGLYEPTDSFTADLENDPETGYAPEKLEAMLPSPCPNNS